MKRRAVLALLIAASAGVWSGRLSAHGLDIGILRRPPAVVLSSAYSGAEPLAYAAVKIYAPGNDGEEFQSGHADAAGRFAFVPDREGQWRAVVDDEMGHRKELTIAVDGAFMKAAKSGGPAGSSGLDHGGAPPSLWMRAAAGVAVIFGAAGILYGAGVRKSAGRERR